MNVFRCPSRETLPLLGALILAVVCLTIQAQGQVSFFTPPTYAGSGTTFVADFNSDGKPDILSADGTLQLGTGNGSFTTGTTVIGGALAVADFNGDGKPDVLQQGVGALLVLLGNGDGTFQAAISTNSGVGTFLQVAATDLNNDHKVDVLLLYNNSLVVFLGKGDGTFAAGVSYPVGQTGFGDTVLTLGDFNGDHITDVAVSLYGLGFPGQEIVLIGNGDGTFQPSKTSTGAYAPASAIAGDFNDDGKLDLIVYDAGLCQTCTPNSVVLLGNGDGTFQAPATAFSGGGTLAAADLNGDGKLDLVVSTNVVKIYVGKGDGTFSNTHSYRNLSPSFNFMGTLALADFNVDGKLDLAAANGILLGNGNGTFQGQPAVPLPFSPSSAVIGDFDKNGTLDLAAVSANNANDLYILTNDGTGALTLAHTYTLQQPAYGIAAADLNGDGKLDLIVTGVDPIYNLWSYSVLLGNGNGSFQSPVFYPQSVSVEPSRSSIAIADFNNDQKPDVAISFGAIGGNQSLALLTGKGDGTFDTPTYVFDGGAGSILSADFNGDGNLDIAAAGSSGLGILLGNGNGTFQPAAFAYTSGLNGLLTAELNGDSKTDLVSNVNGGIQVFLGNGNGTFNPLPPFGGAYYVQAGSDVLADVNGDGKLDIVGTQTLGSRSGYYGVYLGIGDGTFGSFISAIFVGNQPNVDFVLAADMNGDGKQDLIFGDQTSSVFVLLNTTPAGAGASFSPTAVIFPSQAAGSSSNPVSVTLSNTGKTTLTVSAVSINGTNASEFSQTNNCATMQPGASCVINVTFSPTSAGNAAASLSVTDNATGSPQVVALSGTATGLGLTASSSTATISAGSPATYQLSIGGAGWSGQAALSCTGAPKGAACSVAPTSLAVSATSASSLTVTVTTTSRTSAALTPTQFRSSGWLWAVALIAFVILPAATDSKQSSKSRHSGSRYIRALPLLLIFLFPACGGGGSSSNNPQPNPNGTPAGTYTVTVTATPTGGTAQSVPLTLTVQ